MDNKVIKNHATNQRKTIIDMVYKAQSGHPGGSLSATDILSVLYFEEMNIDRNNINSIDRDRFILSKGHASPALYAALAEKGFIDKDEVINTFRQLNSKYQGHPNMSKVPGVDMSTGSLGQGLSCAVGMAIANKLDNNNHRIYCLVGDGESEEGMIWEAAMAANHYKLDNLCVVLDHNHLQIDGNVNDVIGVEPLDEKFKAFGFNVISIDGHDINMIKEAFNKARECKGKPTAIIAETIKGKGVSYMENEAGWHGKAPDEALYKKAMDDLGGQYE